MPGFLNSDGSELMGGLNPTGLGQALQVDASGNVKTVLQTNYNVIGKTYRATATVFTQASSAQTTGGNSGNLAVDAYTEIAVDINITAVSGTSPTLNLFVDRLGADGIWYPIWSSTQQTAVGQVSTSIGAGMLVAQGFGATVRLRWTIGGTTPSWTFSASIQGK